MIRAIRLAFARRRANAERREIIASARNRLAQMVAANRASFALQDHNKRRAAALKGRAHG